MEHRELALQFARLFAKLLGQKTAKCLLRYSSQATTCYYQFNHSKVEAIPLSALPKDTTSESAGLSAQYPFLILNVKQGSYS